MFNRLLTALVLLSTLLVAQPSHAARLSRQEIKAMPILERPYRVGHVYGNTVRRGSRGGSQTDPAAK